MGKIDKEKLLEDCKCLTDGYNFTYCMNQCKKYRGGENFQECITRVIKNFPEEPEIDFDALLKEYEEKYSCKKTLNCDNCTYPNKLYYTTICFVDFLKSKNLTQPQVDMDKLREQVYFEMMAQKPVLEIPMKEVYRIKENYRDFCFAFAIPYSDKIKNVVKNDPRLKYCDITKMPDYSKIPKGSIVECVTKTAGTIYDKIGRVTETQVWFNHYSNIAMSNIVSIRIVELAKE